MCTFWFNIFVQLSLFILFIYLFVVDRFFLVFKASVLRPCIQSSIIAFEVHNMG